MIGQIIERILLVITLILSAHLIRPFSVNNFTNHFIQSSRTFKSILPASQGASFDHANLLAMTLNQILFAGEQREEGVVSEGRMDVAVNRQFEHHSCSDENDPPIKISRPETLAKRSIRIESAEKVGESIHLSSETYQIEREVEVASTSSKAIESEVAPELHVANPASYVSASSPVVLPVVRTNKYCTRIKLRPFSAEPLKIIPSRFHLFNQPRKVNCDFREKKIVKIIALAYLDKSILSILGCEREENESEATESQPLNSESKPNETQEAENFDLFLTRPKAEGCSIN